MNKSLDKRNDRNEFTYEVTFNFKDTNLNDILKLADFEHKRSISKTEQNKVIIKAKDATALRATVDGYIKALKIYETTKEFLNLE